MWIVRLEFMIVIPDIVFLILGLACLMVLLSIRNELKKISHPKRRRTSEWSFEDQLKHRVKYLHHCRHIEKYLNNLKNKTPGFLQGPRCLEEM
jgi:hypothetical protein